MRLRSIVRHALLWGAAAWMGFCGAASADPGAQWEAVPAERIGSACRATLDGVRRRAESLDTTGLFAVQDGRVLLQYGDVSETGYIASARKSVLAMLYGPWVANGTIQLDRTLEQLEIDDDVGGLLPIEKTATLRHLLTARSGVYHPAANGGDSSAHAPARGTRTPGRYFLYNNWDFNAAGTAFEKLTGRGIYDAFQEQLAQPLQLQDFEHARHKRGGARKTSEHLAYHFRLSARDMARLGQLMLNEGRWGEQQLIAPEWVRLITREVTPVSAMDVRDIASMGLGYGYLWWVFEEPAVSPLAGAYTAVGAFGQYLTVVPKRRLVIAHKVAASIDNGSARRVSWQDYAGLVRQLADAPCP